MACLCLSAAAQPSPKINQTDTQGRKQGTWKQYYGMPQGGGLKYVGQFKDGNPVGTFKFYFKSGAVKSITRYKGNGNAWCEIYYESGELVSKGKFTNEKRDSTWYYYYPDGKLQAIEHYNVGKKIGKWQEFYKDGKTVAVEKNYIDGKANGYYYMYTPGGQVTEKKLYKDDKLNGLSQFYYPDGKIHVKGNYKNDFKNGKWYFYSDDSSTVKTKIYNMGVPKGGEPVYPEDTVKLNKNQIIEDENAKFGIRDGGY